MTELTRFQLRLIQCQSPAFNFERASIALLASFKRRHHLALTVSMDSEWRDPAGWRIDATSRQGGHHG